jgi:tyrosyl-tRNA synthetase
MTNIITDKESIAKALNRAVENAYPNQKAFAKALGSGKRLTAYLGIDPTGPSLHLGHAIAMRKLRELQNMGHRIILLIGDFTAMIGDPTDKAATRKKLTREEVLENCKGYREQANKILDMDGSKTGNPVELKYNNEWLSAMSFADVIELASNFTVQQMLERDMFRRRMSWRSVCPECKNENYVTPDTVSVVPDGSTGPMVISTISTLNWRCKNCETDYTTEGGNELHSPRPVYIHEFMYPLMQAYDSVAMDVDIEIGGNDQTFNMLAGRDLMKSMKGKEKFVLTCKLLTDPTGKKMGKSEGNMITLEDSPEDMFGKVMSWTDGMIEPGFELCTDIDDKEIKSMVKKMALGENPMEYKRLLARTIVGAWHDQESAVKAEDHFNNLFKKHSVPDEMPELKTKAAKKNIIDLLVDSGLATSKTDARRQISQGAVRVSGDVVKDETTEIAITSKGIILQKGKRSFVKIIKS